MNSLTWSNNCKRTLER